MSQTAVGRRALLIKSSVNNLETRLLNAQNKLMQKVGFGWKKVTGQQAPKPAGLSNSLSNESKALHAQYGVSQVESKLSISSKPKVPLNRSNTKIPYIAKNIIRDCTPGEPAQKAIQFECNGAGGFEKALEDFKSIKYQNTKNVSDHKGTKYVGFCEDGSKVILRENSKGLNLNGTPMDGPPTLEFQIKGQRKYIKIRYK